MKEVHIIDKMPEAKALLSDKRLTILRILSQEAATVKQVADKLGEPPAKIHHHVKVLEKAGLIKLVKKHEKGGIIEKYYRAVASRIIVDQPVGGYEETTLILPDSRAAREPTHSKAIRVETAEVHATKEELAEFTERLDELLKDFQKLDGTENVKREKYKFAVALYPSNGEDK